MKPKIVTYDQSIGGLIIIDQLSHDLTLIASDNTGSELVRFLYKATFHTKKNAVREFNIFTFTTII